MHPLDCPEFEYKDHPNKAALLPERAAELYSWVEEERIDIRNGVADSRSYHQHLFEDLCPPGCYYYAGHYRGEPFRCLRHYGVVIPSDPMVGAPPREVTASMAEFVVAFRAGVAALDDAFKAPRSRLDRNQFILYVVAFACRIFVRLLTIHPYANGNGHIARFCLVAILAKYGLVLTGWPIDPSPQPPYAELIYRHRRGDQTPLEAQVLRMCKPI